MIPEDFAPPISDDGRLLRWRGTIAGKRYELGLRPERTEQAIAAARAMLRQQVWDLHECARTGNCDAMTHASVDRHKARAVPSP